MVRKRFARAALLALFLLAPGAAAAADDIVPPPPVHVVGGHIAVDAAGGSTYVFSGAGFRASTPIRVGVNGIAVASATTSPKGVFTVRIELDGTGPFAVTGLGQEPNGLWRVVTAAADPAQANPQGSPGRDESAPTRVYTNLAASLAVVLFVLMGLVFFQALRRPSVPR